MWIGVVEVRLIELKNGKKGKARRRGKIKQVEWVQQK
jgi:hypothetical protein